jgi:hypothetical protein
VLQSYQKRNEGGGKIMGEFLGEKMVEFTNNSNIVSKLNEIQDCWFVFIYHFLPKRMLYQVWQIHQNSIIHAI